VFFEFNYTLRVGFIANQHGNECMHVYKNSTRSSLTCLFWRTHAIIRMKVHEHKLKSMLNISAVRFYDNFGLICKHAENMATQNIENWKLSSTPLSIDAGRAATVTVANINTSCISPVTRVHGEHFCRWQYGSMFIRRCILVSESKAEKSSQTDDENKF